MKGPAYHQRFETRSQGRIERLFDEAQAQVHRRTDRLFAGLLAFQCLVQIVVANWLSPQVWSARGGESQGHVWFALTLGAAIVAAPLWLALAYPGRMLTRHVIAIAQMLSGALLIHLVGGRMETHFHVFGSLAFLCFYGDYRVLITGTFVTILDHFLRGIFWPES